MSPQEPSIWLKHSSLTNISPERTASFVEYLRWMRLHIGDTTIDNGTKLELFKNFENNDFSETLNRLTNRTKKLADFSFKVTCPWRIRVGGTKAPESMLLPAFDNSGMPYIPSSTLRGVAREIARQDKNTTDTEVKEIFGYIDSDNTKMGQVVFLDAYPLAGEKKQGGLAIDMANSIWKWDSSNQPQYEPNPNIFLSLQKPIFVIGLNRTKDCSKEVLLRTRNWLLQGLIDGIGSRVNSGYGELRPTGKIVQEVKESKIIVLKPSIVKIQFQLEGQLTNLDKNTAECRPVAFRSMLRYWFRTLGLGVLSPNQVKNTEMKIFGGLEINPHTNKPYTGLLCIEVSGEVKSLSTQNSLGLMSGRLTLRKNSQFLSLSRTRNNTLTELLKNLTWIMFHLGGVGQGARRPLYKRSNNPWYRGSKLRAISNSFEPIPDTCEKFESCFHEKLTNFYQKLAEFVGQQISLSSLKNSRAKDAVDCNCKIYVCQGENKSEKNYALKTLHSEEFNPIKEVFNKKTKRRERKKFYDRELCGGAGNPSPIWIADLDNYQVVTVFGANNPKRIAFINKLNDDAYKFLQIFPIN